MSTMGTLLALSAIAALTIHCRAVTSERDSFAALADSLTATNQTAVSALQEQRGMAAEAYRAGASMFRMHDTPPTEMQLDAGFSLWFRTYSTPYQSAVDSLLAGGAR